MAKFDNLPGIFGKKLDGNLAVLPTNGNPVVLILGTATKGTTEQLYRVDKTNDAVSVYGKTGTLVRGMYEATVGGAVNMRLFRIGATAAKLEDIGSSPGLVVETIAKDDSAGTDYSIFFEASTSRLRVFRVSDSVVVYDNNPSYPLLAIDLGEVEVSGDVTGTPVTDIGALATPVTLAAADALGDGPAVFTAGTDGTNLSRMELYEALYNAYELLSDQDVDVVIPMNVYLDDKNVMDQAGATSPQLAIASYPAAGVPEDALGKLYVEEYLGVNYFWWWFPSDSDGDADGTFTGDGGANIFPTAGSAGATTKTDGTALTGSDFHEVNFGYQLANFCYQQSEQNAEMTGVIGVLPPNSFSLKDVANWVGTLPTTAEDANGNLIITKNGTGLLGNKFMSGRASLLNIPGFFIDGLDGLFNGGFIATDSTFLDGGQLKDENDALIDIGKHLSVVATYPILANPSSATSYSTTGAPTYAGFYSVLPPSSAPTNKLLPSVRLPFRVGTTKLDLLAGQRYVTFHAKTKGIVVSDAPTAARPNSDYRRLSTVRIVKAAVDDVREVGEPFLGEGMSSAKLSALDTAIDRRLRELVKDETLVRYEHRVISTPAQRVLGEADVELKLVPAFELRQITVTVGLAAV